MSTCKIVMELMQHSCGLPVFENGCVSSNCEMVVCDLFLYIDQLAVGVCSDEFFEKTLQILSRKVIKKYSKVVQKRKSKVSIIYHRLDDVYICRLLVSVIFFNLCIFFSRVRHVIKTLSP